LVSDFDSLFVSDFDSLFDSDELVEGLFDVEE